MENETDFIWEVHASAVRGVTAAAPTLKALKFDRQGIGFRRSTPNAFLHAIKCLRARDEIKNSIEAAENEVRRSFAPWEMGFLHAPWNNDGSGDAIWKRPSRSGVPAAASFASIERENALEVVCEVISLVCGGIEHTAKEVLPMMEDAAAACWPAGNNGEHHGVLWEDSPRWQFWPADESRLRKLCEGGGFDAGQWEIRTRHMLEAIGKEWASELELRLDADRMIKQLDQELRCALQNWNAKTVGERPHATSQEARASLPKLLGGATAVKVIRYIDRNPGKTGDEIAASKEVHLSESRARVVLAALTKRNPPLAKVKKGGGYWVTEHAAPWLKTSKK